MACFIATLADRFLDVSHMTTIGIGDVHEKSHKIQARVEKPFIRDSKPASEGNLIKFP